MAAKRRHWKAKGGRFWARLAIPVALRPRFDGKSELLEPLGGDLKIADRNHAGAVARLQAKLEEARRSMAADTSFQSLAAPTRPITAEDLERAVWGHYTMTLTLDELKRSQMPTQSAIDAEFEKTLRMIESGEADPAKNPYGAFNIYTDYELKAGAKFFDKNRRLRRLNALRAALTSDDLRILDEATGKFVTEHHLTVDPGSDAWRALASKLARAEIEALNRTLERDEGVFDGSPTDPIIKPPVARLVVPPVPLMELFRDYMKARHAIGKHRDGGRGWEQVFEALAKFLGHQDARRITKRNLLDWRDSLLSSGLAPKTIADKHLAAVRAVLRWAFENDRLPSNEAEAVKQPVPRKVAGRERGYTDAEALAILKACRTHKPRETKNPSNRESAHITAAKQWVPLLCAFTGARITEMTQLRREDIRQESECWVLRITPDAGSVKTGEFRDVPLHRQVVDLGFLDFVRNAPSGPLFHGAKDPDKYLVNARTTGGRLSEWLHQKDLVPDGVQPNYGWRHRFKTQGRDLAVSDRVLDAIQGHPGKRASDGYGDVTIVAKLRVIDALPDYPLATAGLGS